MKKTSLTILVGLSFLSCYDNKNEEYLTEIQKIKIEKDSIETLIDQYKRIIDNRMIRSLTFQDGNAENAMKLYVDIFDSASIISISRWGKGAPVDEGKIMQATFDLNGNLFMCSDSPPSHEWDFTPAVSNYIDCENEEEMERLFSRLSENGKVTMALANYGFSQKFGWVIDQYGVSWQLNLK